MNESPDVRLARIEQSMVYVHEKMDHHHKELMGAIAPISRKVEHHNERITVFGRDRFWIFTLFGFFITSVVGTASYALIEILKK